MNLTAYCLDWHIKNSDAFRDMLVGPLQPHVNISLKAWNGEKLNKTHDPDQPLIFCMLPPPESLLGSSQRMVWLPMWDQAQGYSQDWWNSLPKQLRVVAFSDVIYKKAMAAGLPTLRITYFKDPSDFKPVNWNNRTVFYWNRTGMVGPEFLTRLCEVLRPDELIFMGVLDPRIDEDKYYELPKKIQDTKVTNIFPTDRNIFLKNTERANIMIAPRLTEGVGMTFLEHMSRGGVVIANNAPTMSEYIDSGRNGLLFDNDYHSIKDRLSAARRFKSVEKNNPAPFLLSSKQPWEKLRYANLEDIGKEALNDHSEGYKSWLHDIEKYADFILSW